MSKKIEEHLVNIARQLETVKNECLKSPHPDFEKSAAIRDIQKDVEKLMDRKLSKVYTNAEAKPPYQKGDQVVYVTEYETRFFDENGDPLTVEKCHFDDMENCWCVAPKNFGGFHGPAANFKCKEEAVTFIKDLFSSTTHR